MENILALNIRFLRKSKGLTQDQLADKLGVNRAMIGSYEEGRAVPKLSAIQDMARYFNVSLDELVNADISSKGDHEVSKNISGKGLRVLASIVDRDNKELVTLVPVKASAGYLNGYGDPDFIENLPRFSLPLPELSNDRTYRAFQINGNSMNPILPGSYIICEYLQDWHDIKEGKTYILVTSDEGIVYKRIYKTENDGLILKSDNREYEPYTIPIVSLVEVWKALGYICFTLPEPDELSLGKLSTMMLSMQKEIEELKKGSTLKY
jgi:transcriptional regulator with XRE-family HTH domain